MGCSERLSRRLALRVLGGAGLAMPLVGCGQEDWYGTDVSGTLPDLSFALTRARDGEPVTEADYRGKVAALFFGYTFCPDVCPMTLANLAAVADELGPDAADVSILFVTVDPERDTPGPLAGYVQAFTKRAVGLRGTPDQLAVVTRRYRVTYKIAPHAPGASDYAVSHGKTVYLFDRRGKARLIWPQFDTAGADVEGAASDLRRLIRET